MVIGKMVIGKMVIGKMVIGKMVIGQMVIGKMVIGKMVIGKRGEIQIKFMQSSGYKVSQKNLATIVRIHCLLDIQCF